MKVASRLLDFEASYPKILGIVWLVMLVSHYAIVAAGRGDFLAASSVVDYLCGGVSWVDDSYAFPMLLAFAVSVLAVIVFICWGQFESKTPRSHPNGSSVAGAALLSASLCFFMSFVLMPCDPGNLQGNGMGLAKVGLFFLALGNENFIFFSFFHSILISYFYNCCVILIRSQRR